VYYSPTEHFLDDIFIDNGEFRKLIGFPRVSSPAIEILKVELVPGSIRTEIFLNMYVPLSASTKPPIT